MEAKKKNYTRATFLLHGGRLQKMKREREKGKGEKEELNRERRKARK